MMNLTLDARPNSCRDQAFHAAALPPDVRRGSAPPSSLDFRIGYALGSGFAPKFYGPKAEPWAQPKTLENLDGGAEPRLTSGDEAVTDESNLLSALDFTSRGEAATTRALRDFRQSYSDLSATSGSTLVARRAGM